MIASCSQDKKVIVWTSPSGTGEWKLSALQMPTIVWSVSWSVTGNLLAVSCGDHTVTLWKQSLNGEWAKVSDVTDEGVQDVKSS